MDKSPPVDKDMWEAVIQISKMIYERTNHFIPESDIAAIIRKHQGVAPQREAVKASAQACHICGCYVIGPTESSPSPHDDAGADKPAGVPVSEIEKLWASIEHLPSMQCAGQFMSGMASLIKRFKDPHHG